jgi:hypothetical protein
MKRFWIVPEFLGQVSLQFGRSRMLENKNPARSAARRAGEVHGMIIQLHLIAENKTRSTTR